jgi:hypothetical protein
MACPGGVTAVGLLAGASILGKPCSLLDAENCRVSHLCFCLLLESCLGLCCCAVVLGSVKLFAAVSVYKLLKLPS